VETTVAKPLRADARRNRDAILTAAKAVFAKHGPDAQMDDIARRAKLGVGTLYRHFPNKDALVQALLADRFEQIAGFSEEGLEHEDAFAGLCHAMRSGAELAARDRGVSQLFGQIGAGAAVAAAQARVLDALGQLIRRARADGTLRPDFAVEDIPYLMCGVVSAMHTIDADNWQRHLQLILDGMRARPDLDPLPG
jgi:AcrR family transcriptional regulator